MQDRPEAGQRPGLRVLRLLRYERQLHKISRDTRIAI